jgi:DNA-directed RNA polymerase subunit M/transcription elongation factor TFIIS
MAKAGEIICTACGQESLPLRKPKYEGLKKVGETLQCSSCGHEYEDEESVAYKTPQKTQVFTDSDRSKNVELFAEDEAKTLCRYCANYVVNPFMQWCGLHKKEVQATDTCPDFVPDDKPEDADSDHDKGIKL